MSEDHAGFDEMSKYPLFEALHKRRSRRIGLGLEVGAGGKQYLHVECRAAAAEQAGESYFDLRDRPDRPHLAPTGRLESPTGKKFSARPT